VGNEIEKYFSSRFIVVVMSFESEQVDERALLA
jgi:hypothetical protein